MHPCVLPLRHPETHVLRMRPLHHPVGQDARIGFAAVAKVNGQGLGVSAHLHLLLAAPFQGWLSAGAFNVQGFASLAAHKRLHERLHLRLFG